MSLISMLYIVSLFISCFQALNRGVGHNVPSEIVQTLTQLYSNQKEAT